MAWSDLVLAIALLSPIVAPAGTPSAGEPDGCQRVDAHVQSCHWTMSFSPTQLSPGQSTSTQSKTLPQAGRSVLRVTISTSQREYAYHWSICEGSNTTHCMARGHDENINTTPAPVPTQAPANAIPFIGIVSLDRDASARFKLDQQWVNYQALPANYPQDFDIMVTLDDRVGSVPAGGSAGSPEDPQLRDAADDATPKGIDITGAWFDQPVLDDGFIDVGIVAPRLAALDASGSSCGFFQVTWSVLGHRYQAAWSFGEYGQATGAPGEDWTAVLVAPNTANLANIPAVIDERNGTLRTTIPLVMIGDPGPDDRFDQFSASSASAADRTCVSGSGQVQDQEGRQLGQFDDANSNVRPFAIGGPAVWAKLRGETIAPAPAPWYRDPLAPANLPNTLQTAGAAIAVATFLGGFLLLQRRRRKLRRFAAEIDGAARGADATAAIHALDALEARFAQMHLDGELDQGQYDFLARRIERHLRRMHARPLA